ncbi:glycosyltransferase [Rhizobium sp. P32RR-XVIII]|uniref:glycosyltransferase n=1 Tax=Rhizobium sp. P32RR-XVIII TaxID=2726738 RepID=UPI0014571CA5|nr:glycosyltransferase [Rhizobium sp. P32RR-XVIII]NLS07947.1 glycosyltransferase [Rhizobium sp. P32RR-XVIII]
MLYMLAVVGLLLAIHIISLMIAGWRISRRGLVTPDLSSRPPVSIVIPVCGLEQFSRETIACAHRLDWTDYELIFCVADRNDPVVAAIESARLEHPTVKSRTLVGDDRFSANPKLNNCLKGWNAAAHDWIVLADSNVLMPPDYLHHLMAAWRSDSGLVCSTPLGARPQGFWAEVECAFLNTHQARWQYAGEALGFGFAQGKSMLWRKETLDGRGGIQALAAEIAEDAAATKLVNGLGLKVHLVASPFEQPLGRRTVWDVWSRQCRWARLRRVTFPIYFAAEIFLGLLPPLLLVFCLPLSEVGLAASAVAVLAAVYLPELALANSKNWHLSPMSLAAMIARDVMMPIIWMRSWLGKTFEWRGNTMTIGPQDSRLSEAPAAQM